MKGESGDAEEPNYFDDLGLHDQLRKNLHDHGYTNMFKIQKLIVPKLIQTNARKCIQPRHILASAPTGSGKTLAYVVPILQALQRHPFTPIRLKALIILPTRELANQVYEVFHQLSFNLNVKVALITGSNSFEDEQMILVGKMTNQFTTTTTTTTTINDNSEFHRHHMKSIHSDNNNTITSSCSLVDIVVCTPGRLQDHLQFTLGFTLQYLQFLVLDEADRLLGNAYHHWVKSLIQEISYDNIISHNSSSASASASSGCSSNSKYRHSEDYQYITPVLPLSSSSRSLLTTTTATGSIRSFTTSSSSYNNPTLTPTYTSSSSLSYDQSSYSSLSPVFIQPNHTKHHVQRLLFSATLTNNPAKLALLGIKNPLIYRVTQQSLSSTIMTPSINNSETDIISERGRRSESIITENNELCSSSSNNSYSSSNKVNAVINGEESINSMDKFDDNSNDENMLKQDIIITHTDTDDTIIDKEIQESSSSNEVVSELVKLSQLSQSIIQKNILNQQQRQQTNIHEMNESNNYLYYLPSLLTESIVICDTSRRLLILTSLLYQACCLPANIPPLTLSSTSTSPSKFLHDITGCCYESMDMIIIFTSSVTTTHKLCTLLQIMNNHDHFKSKKNKSMEIQPDINSSKKQKLGDSMMTTTNSMYTNNSIDSNTSSININNTYKEKYFYHGDIQQISRNIDAMTKSSIIQECKIGHIKILVTTDQMARGIDLPNIKLVINYDCPNDVRTYLHRVGRTARGHQNGHALTLLKIGQVNGFYKLHKDIQYSDIQRQLYDQYLSTHTHTHTQSSTTTNITNTNTTTTTTTNTTNSATSNRMMMMKTKCVKEIEDQLNIRYIKALKLLPTILNE